MIWCRDTLPTPGTRRANNFFLNVIVDLLSTHLHSLLEITVVVNRSFLLILNGWILGRSLAVGIDDDDDVVVARVLIVVFDCFLVETLLVSTVTTCR